MAVADGGRAAARGDRLVKRSSALSCWSVPRARRGCCGGAITPATICVGTATGVRGLDRQGAVHSVQGESARTSTQSTTGADPQFGTQVARGLFCIIITFIT